MQRNRPRRRPAAPRACGRSGTARRTIQSRAVQKPHCRAPSNDLFFRDQTLAWEPRATCNDSVNALAVGSLPRDARFPRNAPAATAHRGWAAHRRAASPDRQTSSPARWRGGGERGLPPPRASYPRIRTRRAKAHAPPASTSAAAAGHVSLADAAPC
eukprot:59561-Chlamydomonas_euryale.AAC.3